MKNSTLNLFPDVWPTYNTRPMYTHVGMVCLTTTAITKLWNIAPAIYVPPLNSCPDPIRGNGAIKDKYMALITNIKILSPDHDILLSLDSSQPLIGEKLAYEYP